MTPQVVDVAIPYNRTVLIASIICGILAALFITAAIIACVQCYGRMQMQSCYRHLYMRSMREEDDLGDMLCPVRDPDPILTNINYRGPEPLPFDDDQSIQYWWDPQDSTVALEIVEALTIAEVDIDPAPVVRPGMITITEEDILRKDNAILFGRMDSSISGDSSGDEDSDLRATLLDATRMMAQTIPEIAASRTLTPAPYDAMARQMERAGEVRTAAILENIGASAVAARERVAAIGGIIERIDAANCVDVASIDEPLHYSPWRSQFTPELIAQALRRPLSVHSSSSMDDGYISPLDSMSGLRSHRRSSL